MLERSERIPPKSAQNNAKKALKWRKEHGDEVKGGTRIGWTRANQIASGEALSEDVIKRMAQFNRHRENSKIDQKFESEPWKDRGYVAWLLWGGSSGVDWAINKSKKIQNMSEVFMSKDVDNVDIFSVGTWNGMKFTLEDLEEIVSNTNRLLSKGTNKPPLKIGHSTNQIMKGQSDGDPALGWIDNLRIVGKKIVADFKKVPEILVKAFKEGLYKQVSVEMRNIQETGWFLTAVAVLGADLPAVKTLKDIEAFLSEQLEPHNLEEVESALCFTTIDPIFHMEKKMENEIQSQEVDALRLKLAEVEKENAAFKQREIESKFSEAKSAILSSYNQDVKDGKLSPAMRDKISAKLDEQKHVFTDGSQLSIPADMVKEITEAYSSIKLPQGETSSSVSFSEDDNLRIDQLLEVKVAEIQASTGKNYIECCDLVFKANPGFAKQYKQFTQDISEGRL